MEKVKAFIFRNDEEDDITVIMEDGGVAYFYNPEHSGCANYITDYHQNRITPETKLDNIWDELAEGKMYAKDWEGEPNRDEVIDDMINWLYCTTEAVEIVKVEMGELTEETFQQVKKQIIFEQV